MSSKQKINCPRCNSEIQRAGLKKHYLTKKCKTTGATEIPPNVAISEIIVMEAGTTYEHTVVEAEEQNNTCYVCMRENQDLVDTCGSEFHKVCGDCRSELVACPMDRIPIPAVAASATSVWNLTEQERLEGIRRDEVQSHIQEQQEFNRLREEYPEGNVREQLQQANQRHGQHIDIPVEEVIRVLRPASNKRMLKSIVKLLLEEDGSFNIGWITAMLDRIKNTQTNGRIADKLYYYLYMDWVTNFGLPGRFSEQIAQQLNNLQGRGRVTTITKENIDHYTNIIKERIRRRRL